MFDQYTHILTFDWRQNTLHKQLKTINITTIIKILQTVCRIDMPSALNMYTQVHKYFLQCMLNNGTFNYDEAKQYVTQVAGKLGQRKIELNSVLCDVNEKIIGQCFRIDTQICEISGNKMCVLVNTTNDEISQISFVSPSEVEYFEKLMSEIMLSDSKCLSSISCLNLTSRLTTNMTKDLAQSKIEYWCKVGYLVKQGGMIYLGARTIVEFQLYLKNQFPNRITDCSLCTTTVYFGKICAECSEVFHIHCMSRYLQKNKKCPSCKKPWNEAEGRSYEEYEEQESSEDSS